MDRMPNVSAARAGQRASKLDSHKARSCGCWPHPSPQQLLQRLRQMATPGLQHPQGIRARRAPTGQPAFLKLHFAPGQCARWIGVRPDFCRWAAPAAAFLLCHGALLQPPDVCRFTLAQTQEHFLAFTNTPSNTSFVPDWVMVENCKTASCPICWAHRVLHPRYLTRPPLGLRSRLAALQSA